MSEQVAPGLKVDVVHYSARINTPELDRRYRTLVVLARSDRPQNHPFHCHRCMQKVAEIVNYDVSAVTDVVDMNNMDNNMVGWRCDGKYFDQTLDRMVNCRHWYYFLVN